MGHSAADLRTIIKCLSQSKKGKKSIQCPSNTSPQVHLKQPAPEAVPGGSAVPFGERKVILPRGHRPTGHLPRNHCSFQGATALSAVPEFSLTRSSLLFLPLGNTPTAIPKAKIKSRGRGKESRPPWAPTLELLHASCPVLWPPVSC